MLYIEEGRKERKSQETRDKIRLQDRLDKALALKSHLTVKSSHLVLVITTVNTIYRQKRRRKVIAPVLPGTTI